jgi:hypothetical protein
VTTSFRLDPALLQRVKDAAWAHRLQQSGFIIAALEFAASHPDVVLKPRAAAKK